jgi:hypothetical protein
MSQEFSTVSASSYDAASLAAKLTEKAGEGWTVVSIVPTGGDITAFLTRESTGASSSAATPDYSSSSSSTPAYSSSPAATSAPAAAEPAGWGTAPAAAPVAPIAEAAPAYQPAYAPAPAAAPAAAPAVPAGWYADPAARFDLRYWDGGTWTEHVSRAGQQFTDPPVA